MICYMPEIYEYETVYSWFCRYYTHSGYPYYKYALEDLFIKQEGCPMADLEFIGNLNEDAKAVISSVYPIIVLMPSLRIMMKRYVLPQIVIPMHSKWYMNVL